MEIFVFRRHTHVGPLAREELNVTVTELRDCPCFTTIDSFATAAVMLDDH